MKTADEILKELAECDNPVTSSSLKTVAIAKLKQERDRYRKALDDIKLVGTYKFANSHYTFIRRERVCEIINEVLK